MNLNELQRSLRQRRLGGMASVFETRLRQAQAEPMAPLDLISCLISDELTRRSDRLLARRRKHAAVAGSSGASGSLAGTGLRTVEEVFCDEQPRLLPSPLHPFPTDRIETVCSHKTIYVRFDLNDYSIPPEAVGRPLTLVASDTTVRILDGAVELARHRRSYDRQQQVLDPEHRDAVLKLKRRYFHATPAGRLEQAVPESKTLLDLAFAQGESAGSQTAQLLKLLEEYGAAALRRAILEALERNTPRASSVAFLLRRQPPPRRVAVDLSSHPEA